MNLRDHDVPCEHNNTRAHGWTTPRPGLPPPGFQRYNRGGGDRWTDRHWCDGGAAVVVDYEAAGRALFAMHITEGLDDDGVEAMALAAVDAALGVTTIPELPFVASEDVPAFLAEQRRDAALGITDS